MSDPPSDSLPISLYKKTKVRNMQIWKGKMEREGTHNYYLDTPSYSMVFFRSKDQTYFTRKGSHFKIVKIEHIFPHNFCFQVFFWIYYLWFWNSSLWQYVSSPKVPKMDRTISSLSNPSPPNSISNPSSSWSPIYSSSSRANKIGAFLLVVSVVRVRFEMNDTNYAKKCAKWIFTKQNTKSPKFNKMSKR